MPVKPGALTGRRLLGRLREDIQSVGAVRNRIESISEKLVAVKWLQSEIK